MSLLAEGRLGSPPSVTTEPASEVRRKQATLHALVDSEESQTTYRFEYGLTAGYGKSIPAVGKSIGQGEEAVEVEETLEGLKPTTTYHFRVSATNLKGTTYGADRTFTTKAAVPPVYTSSFGKAGTGSGEFDAPTGIAVDGAGNVWVADTENDRVEKFGPSGEFILASGSTGTGNGQFNTPKGIAVDAAGNVWVVDTFNHRVQKLDSSGKYLTKFGSQGTGNGQLSQPWGIDVDPDGKIWVVDRGNERVQRFGSSGAYEAKFSTFGSAIGIAADGEGGVWVSESLDSRVRRYTSSGQKLVTIESGSWGAFALPHGLAVDAEGSIWVADTSNHRVRAFAADGQYLTQFGVQARVGPDLVSRGSGFRPRRKPQVAGRRQRPCAEVVLRGARSDHGKRLGSRRDGHDPQRHGQPRRF